MPTTSNGAPTGAQLELTRGAQRAVVTEVGAGLRSWSLDGRELLDGFAADESPSDFRGQVLAPWPNRLRDGRYEFAGVEHRTPITEPERGVALHGLVSGLRWRAGERAADRVAMELELEPRDGYPFALRLVVEYALADRGLVVTLAATNAGGGAAPFGAGFHPYLATGEVDAALVAIPAESLVPVDSDRLLPTGPPVPVAGSPQDFRRERPIGATALNTCYADLERGADGLAHVRVTTQERVIAVWMDEAFPFAMAYTADDVADPARRRGSLAIEPMTCAPDAFNTGLGLRVLAPGETLSARWGMTAGG